MRATLAPAFFKTLDVSTSFQTFLALQVPSWFLIILIPLAWLIQHSIKRFVRTWALLTLPATVLHEFAHWLVGYVLVAQPVNFNIWPKRISNTAWRLGYVGFARLRWWNGGAVALAPLCWTLLITVLLRQVNQVPKQLTVQLSVLASFAVVWLWIAVAPSKSDWQLAGEYWASALLFLGCWVAALIGIIRLS
jgi:hypothetical protein